MGDDQGQRETKESKKVSKKELLAEMGATLSQIADEQRALRAELGRLSARVAALAPAMSSDEALTSLDGYRSQEALGERLFGAWIDVCEDARLRGGLRTIQRREGFHARLLEERIKLLGGSIQAEIPEDVEASAMASFASTSKDDAQKLLDFMSSFPDADAAVAPICEIAERLGSDHETRALLETIVDDERASLTFLAAECARLNPRD